LPVPPFPGKPLDPPLRSRFQARVIPAMNAEQLFDAVAAVAPDVPTSTLQTLVTFAESVKVIENSFQGRAAAAGSSINCPFPDYQLPAIAHTLQMAAVSAGDNFDADAALGPLLARAFPFVTPTVRSSIKLPHQRAIDALFDNLGLSIAPPQGAPTGIVSVAAQSGATPTSGVTVGIGGVVGLELPAPGGQVTPSMERPFPTYVETPTFAHATSEMAQDHAAGRHMCIIGSRGGGKSALVDAFATRFGYRAETFSLYADMSARELLQSRGAYKFALCCKCWILCFLSCNVNIQHERFVLF